MSAYSVGTTAFRATAAKQTAESVVMAAAVTNPATRQAVEDAVAPSREDALSIVVKWVPGEVIGTYAAVVAAMQASAKDKPGNPTGAEGAFLLIFMAMALLLTVLGGTLEYRKVRATGKMPKNKRAELALRGVLSCAGLALWSYVIPGTVTNQSHLAKEYQAAASAMVFLVAIVFGLFAEFMVLPATLRGLLKIGRAE